MYGCCTSIFVHRTTWNRSGVFINSVSMVLSSIITLRLQIYCICIYTQALQYSSLKEADVFSLNQKLLKVLNADSNKYNMSVANKLYGEQTFTFKQVNSVEIL